ncbi:MAG: helix-turn-helix domain-containing protein [Bacillaceae bacterium]
MGYLFAFADWLKEQRELHSLSQSQLSELTDNEIPQSTISAWEIGKTIPSVRNIALIAQSLKIPMSSIPWDYIDFGIEPKDENELNVRMWDYTELEQKAGSDTNVNERYGLYELPSADTIRTFEGKIYEVKGFVGIEKDSGEMEHITDLYYRTKTVVSNNCVLAKRKKSDDELTRLKKPKKVGSK